MVCRREDAWDFEELAVATTTDRLDHMVNQTFPGKSLHEYFVFPPRCSFLI
jgi:hypothetical protein